MMTEVTSTTTPLAVAAIQFRWQKDGKTYDYFIPEGMTVNVGDKVVVETTRGETTVEVVEIKAGSDKAQKKVLRVVEQDATIEGAAA